MVLRARCWVCVRKVDRRKLGELGMVVVMVVPVGYSGDGALKRSRIPLQSIVHWEGW